MRKNGFSLIEMMVVVSIIGLMLALSVQNFIYAMERQHEECTRLNTHTMNAVVQEFILFSPYREVVFADMGSDRLDKLENLIYIGFSRYNVSGYTLNLSALDICEYSTKRGYEGVSSYDLYIKD